MVALFESVWSGLEDKCLPPASPLHPIPLNGTLLILTGSGFKKHELILVALEKKWVFLYHLHPDKKLLHNHCTTSSMEP